MAKSYVDPQRIEKQRARDYKIVFGSEKGKAVLRDICLYHDVFSALTPPFEPGRLEFENGKRAVVMRILQLLKEEPLEKLQEYANDE